jgi:hypothetical protein
MSNNLPETCAATNMDGEPILILNGQTGYYTFPAGLISTDTYNEKHGVTEKAAEVMLAASMFGWEIPAVVNYSEGE